MSKLTGSPVRLSTGALAVFSPVTLTPEVKQTIADKGGNLKYMIAPDIEHHIGITSWFQAYPNARVIGPEGLPEKRAKLSPEDAQVPFHTVITKSNKNDVRIGEDFDAEFEYEFVDAHPNKELVFFHKPSRTLIEADLMFTGPPKEQYSRTGEDVTRGWAAWLVGKIQGVEGSAVGQKRMLWYAFSAKDRAGFARSAKRIGGWNFERIIPCHGDVIEGNAKGIFQKVFEWHLKDQRT